MLLPVMSRSLLATVFLAVMGLAWSGSSTTAFAQAAFGEVKVDAQATGEEISRQPGLWVMEVYIKPLRLIAVDITDPKTGEKKPRFVWYLVYRAINRPLDSPTVQNPAVNELDAPVLPSKFIPEFTLVTDDGDEPKIYADRILPEALPLIERRERRAYKSSVSVVQSLMPPVPADAPEQPFIYGVATFVDIDPDADRYTLYLTGFSNGVQLTPGPDGSTIVQHKTIEMKYWRPGDRFDQQEREIRLEGSPRWIYR